MTICPAVQSCFDADSSYYVEANCLLLASYATNPLTSCSLGQLNYVYGDLPLYMNYYVPIGTPTTLIPAVVPSGATPAIALASMYVGSPDFLMERAFAGGIVLLCPPSGTISPNCGYHTFSPAAYLLNEDAGPINAGGGATFRTYTKITRWPVVGNASYNTGAIVLTSPS